MAEPVFVCGLRIGGPPLAIEKDDGTTEEISLHNLWEAIYDTNYELKTNAEVAQILEQYEKEWNVTIPSVLKTVASWCNIDNAIRYAFPTNNDFVVPGTPNSYRPEGIEHWHLVKENVVASIPGVTHMVRFMNENQGCCYWYAAWNDNDEQCQVYVSPNILPEQNGSYNHEQPWSAPLLTSDDFLTFLIDYAREGDKWYEQRDALYATGQLRNDVIIYL